MSNEPLSAPSGDRELVLSLKLDAPREKIWRCWTEPELLKQWFTPAPWTLPHADVDVRPGGNSRMTMRSPEGDDIAMKGVYLEVIPGRKLVFTDAYTEAWLPSDKPFMTASITLDDTGDGGTAYEAVARHWSVADREAHEEMGFHEGWTQCARQLEALAKSLD